MTFINRQGGSILAMCLMLLLALNLLGLAAASDSQVQSRATANILDQDRLFAAGDISHKWGESWLMSLSGAGAPPPCESPCIEGMVIYPPGSVDPAALAGEMDWWRSHAVEAGFSPDLGTTTALPGIAENTPAYWLVESLPAPGQSQADPEWGGEISWYRIWSRTGSGEDHRFTLTSSVLARPWGDPAWRNALPPEPEAPGFCADLPVSIPCGRLAWTRHQ